MWLTETFFPLRRGGKIESTRPFLNEIFLVVPICRLFGNFVDKILIADVQKVR